MSVRWESETAARSSPSMIIFPDVGLSSPPSRCSIVDLPQPDGPMIATNSPFSTSMDTPRSAGTSILPIMYDLVRFSVLRIAFIYWLLNVRRRRVLIGIHGLLRRAFLKLFVEIYLFERPGVLQDERRRRIPFADRHGLGRLVGEAHRVLFL